MLIYDIYDWDIEIGQFLDYPVGLLRSYTLRVPGVFIFPRTIPIKNGDFPVRYVSHYQRVPQLIEATFSTSWFFPTSFDRPNAYSWHILDYNLPSYVTLSHSIIVLLSHEMSMVFSWFSGKKMVFHCYSIGFPLVINGFLLVSIGSSIVIPFSSIFHGFTENNGPFPCQKHGKQAVA